MDHHIIWLTRSPDGTIGGDEVSKLVQALDTKNFWTQVPVDPSWVTVPSGKLT